jgi:hypothetical protein
MRQKTAINTGNIARPSEGLGNHCSIRLSYGATADFLGFQGEGVKRPSQNAQNGIWNVGT